MEYRSQYLMISSLKHQVLHDHYNITIGMGYSKTKKKKKSKFHQFLNILELCL